MALGQRICQSTFAIFCINSALIYPCAHLPGLRPPSMSPNSFESYAPTIWPPGLLSPTREGLNLKPSGAELQPFLRAHIAQQQMVECNSWPAGKWCFPLTNWNINKKLAVYSKFSLKADSILQFRASTFIMSQSSWSLSNSTQFLFWCLRGISEDCARQLHSVYKIPA